MLKNTSDKILDSTDKVLNQLKEGLSKIGDLGKATKDKFTNYVKEVFDILPILEEAGFVTNSLIVGISIPPSIEIHFSKFKEVDEDTIKKLNKEYKDKKMFKLILKSLLMSNNFQSKIASDNYVPNGICIEISIPPKVSIRYLNKNLKNVNFIHTEFD
ncbi:hypothetical protein D7030_13965 [Flavobacteriaceae bacterium AU392]|nr:hypothetical protein D1817_04525 [Flavobacteriaceae bacterium]RKM81408.1 hypothetical protein D7030_13965 [Flavobacteriaceae bacterium AU392]